jgi:hypothetical protein
MMYGPLDDLLDVIRREKPDAVVLIGPFVDEEHPIVKKCELRESHDAKVCACACACVCVCVCACVCV